MSLYNKDEAFIYALKKHPSQRTEKDLQVIFSRLHRFEALSNMREQSLRGLCKQVRYERHEANDLLYGKDDLCKCWYILLSGSVFSQGSMFLRNTSFGKQIPGATRRGCQCLVLEPSEMIAIDYPEMTPLHAGPGTVRVPNMRNHSSSTSSRSTLDDGAEAEISSVESSPSHSVTRKANGKIGNGQALMMKQHSDDSMIKSRQDYYGDQDDVSHEDPDQEDQQSDMEEEQEDSISLHSSSSLIIKDLVTEVLKKTPTERNEDDHDVLLEFTKSLKAFSNMTEPIRRELCKVMVFAEVDKAGTEILKDKELLDSWSVIINGQVQVESSETEAHLLYMGEGFGVTPTMQPQYHKGVMTTMTEDCQFLCIAQKEYCEVLHQGRENMESVFGEDGLIEMVKEKREIEGGKKGNIVIRGTSCSLRKHLLEENSIDTTYAEDYLLTYRAFSNEPVEICRQLLDWFDREEFKAKVTRVILLWVNNHFNDFECDRHMMELLEKFEEKLQMCNKTGECRLFNIACSTKAKSRVITLSRSSNEEDLTFSITGGTEGYPIYILQVTPNSDAEEKGLKRGDQLLNVNGQNFEKLNMERANAILRKNTELNLTVKTNLFAFKEMMTDLKNPHKKKDKSKKGKFEDAPVIAQISTMQPSRPPRMPSVASESDAFDSKNKKGGTLGKRAIHKMNKVRSIFSSKKDVSFQQYLEQHQGTISENDVVVRDDSFLSAMKPPRWAGAAATIDGPRSFKQAAAHSSSNPDLLDPGAYNGPEVPTLTEVPEDVIKVFRADQTYRFVFVNQDTTAEEAVKSACKEFGIVDNVKNFSLCRVSVQNENFVKQSKLPDKLSNLSEIPLSARYYLKNNMESEQLLPDENIPELLKEANYTFLDLNCFEVALHLTLQDYELFKTVEQTDFIDDLFSLNEDNLSKFKAFEDLVNRELFWVVSTMCLEPNVLRRSKIIKHFTKIAHHCKTLKNLNSTFAIISGLGYRAVSRMKTTWEKVPAKCQRTFEDLQNLMDPSRNMSKYRTLLNDLTSQPPVIPYIPVVKKDLTFLDLGNDTMVEGLVNFEKMRMIGREVRNVCRLCNAEASQIISSALAHHHDADKPSSNIYHTLTRRGRRSSFNNARKMYEDAVNARRVKQYMQQLKIENDEDKLMEMSKQVEPATVTSAQTKRRNTAATLLDSPSRNSKTLPGGLGPKAAAQARNNSEPQLQGVAGLSIPPSRKKNPASSLPKFGTTSPHAISKLLALSEESGDGGSSGSSKHGSLEQRRSGSASASSRELSPATSPYLSPRRDLARSKGSVSSSDSAHSIAHENTNRNNNNRGCHRHDFPASASLRSSIRSKHLSHPLPSNSSSSSARSSIASSSSLGVSSTSLNAAFSSSSSPRSSPNHMATGPPAADHGRPNSYHSHPHVTYRNSPVRSSSSSSADTVKSAGRSSSERPVIMQGRSGSFGQLSVTTISSDQRAAAASSAERRMTGSSPSLSVRAAASHHHLILPNIPQIARCPSIDSGVVSMGSLSADSTRFLNSESDIFPKPSHRSSASLSSSEGYASQQSLLMGNAGVMNHQSPVMRRHLQNLQRQGGIPKPAAPNERGEGSALTQNQHPGRPRSSTHPDKSGPKDDIKQTFLSGCRGWGDAPLQRDKDPWPTEAKLPPESLMTAAGPAGWPSPAHGSISASVGEPQFPAEYQNPPSYNGHHRSEKPGEFKGGGGDVVDGFLPKTQRKTIVTGSGQEIQQYYERLRMSQERPNPPSSLSFHPPTRRSQDAKTPEAMLEEKLLLELEQQKPRLNKSFDSSGVPQHLHSPYGYPAPLAERHSVSFTGLPLGYRGSPSTPTGPPPESFVQYNMGNGDPGMNQGRPGEYPLYPDSYCTKPGCKCPSSRAAEERRREFAKYGHAEPTPSYHPTVPPHALPPSQNLPPPMDPRSRWPQQKAGDNVFMSDFSDPSPRTFLPGPRRPDDTRTQNTDARVSMPYYCPKHGSPLVNNTGLPEHYPQTTPNMRLPPSVHNSTPEGHMSPYERTAAHLYTPIANDPSQKQGFSHSRSTSDVSMNSDIYDRSDTVEVAYNNCLNKMAQYELMTNSPGYPSPIDPYDSPRTKAFFPETPSSATSSSHSIGSMSSTPKSHAPANPPRRKSTEWGVTDLDKENQQQAMQVWTSGSSATQSPAKNSTTSKDGPSVSSAPPQTENNQSKSESKRKKPPPPLPPQRNSSYGVTRHLRLSSGTLSPLSSPPNSPTTPVPLNKLSLNENQPQLVVKTMVENVPDSDLTPPQPTPGHGPAPRPLMQANGVIPHMNKAGHSRPQEQVPNHGRMLPSYDEALNHITSQNKSFISPVSLPAYQNYKGTRDSTEQTSQV